MNEVRDVRDPDSTPRTTQSTTSLEDRFAALATDFRQAIEKQQAENAALRAELESRQLETKVSDAVTQPVQEHDLNPRDTSYWSLNAMGALLPSHFACAQSRMRPAFCLGHSCCVLEVVVLAGRQRQCDLELEWRYRNVRAGAGRVDLFHPRVVGKVHRLVYLVQRLSGRVHHTLPVHALRHHGRG